MQNYFKKSDAYLLKQITKGKHQEFYQLIKRHQKTCYRIAWRTVLNKNDAQDIVQDTFLKIWQYPQKYNPNNSLFTTWLYKVIINACYDSNRKKVTTNSDFHELIDESNFENTNDQNKLLNCLQKLSVVEQQVINLFYYEDLSTKQTAEILTITPKAVESCLGRARKKLQLLLEL